MLSSNQIVGFFDHQYLLKKSFNFLDFLRRESYPGKETMKVLLLVGHGQVCPASPRAANFLEVFWGHIRDTATLES